MADLNRRAGVLRFHPARRFIWPKAVEHWRGSRHGRVPERLDKNRHDALVSLLLWFHYF
jgi:hypothetical protein